jgi:predicted N-acetyltransferase YhbS
LNLPSLEIKTACAQDGIGIQRIAASIPLFNREDVACVEELWNEFLRDGSANDGYAFLTACQDGLVIGFACFGHRPLTEGTFDLYWIAVDPQLQKQGVGSAILRQTEEAIHIRGGKLVIVETSGGDQFRGTRRFYERNLYHLEANIADFYRPGENLVIFSKRLA